MDKENYPDFIAYYRDSIENEESYPHFLKMSREFNNKDAKLDQSAGKPIEDLTLKMDKIGKTKTLEVTPAKSALREEYKGKADETARQHGFKGLSYDEHMKQKEKQEATPEQTSKEHASPAAPEKETEAKQPEVPLTDREIKRQAVLEEIRQITERNRNRDRDRSR